MIFSIPPLNGSTATASPLRPGKPLNQQIGLWIDAIQSLLDTELVLLLEDK